MARILDFGRNLGAAAKYTAANEARARGLNKAESAEYIRARVPILLADWTQAQSKKPVRVAPVVGTNVEIVSPGPEVGAVTTSVQQGRNLSPSPPTIRISGTTGGISPSEFTSLSGNREPSPIAMSLLLGPASPAITPTPANTLTVNGSTLGAAVGGLLGGTGAAIGGIIGGIGEALLGGGGNDQPGRAVPAPVVQTTLSGSALTALPLEAPSGGFVARRPNRRMVRRLVMLVGVEAAASIIGYGVPQTAMMAMTGFRRSRGISARDLRVTKRVTRRVLGIARDLAALKPRACRR